MDEISLKALAKINLGLDVLGKREDGYHEVRMVMQTIHLYDRVEIKKTRSPYIHVETNLYYLPVNEDNLVYRAAKLMKDEFQIKEGVRIVLQKFIPVAAGLAGGSSDAAAVLVGMNRIFNLGLKQNKLMELGLFLKTLRNVEKLEVLPYHSMGKVKYDNLGMDYVLKDTPQLTKAEAKEAEHIIRAAMEQ